jgi:hypothetical protein
MEITTTPMQIRIISRSVACRVVGLTWVSYVACIRCCLLSFGMSIELALRGIQIRPSGHM